MDWKLPFAGRPWQQSLLLSVFLTILIMGTAPRTLPLLGTDDFFYRQIALGEIARVPQPFSARILHPFLVRGIHLATDISVDHIYFIIGIVCVFLLSLVLQRIAQRRTVPYSFIIPLLAVPAFIRFGHAYYFTDLLFALLLACFFLQIQRRSLTHPLSLVLLLLLYLTRESTILLSLVCIALSLMKREWKTAGMVGLVSLIGWNASGFMGQLGLANAHGLSSPIYLAGKFAFNGLRNILGLPIFPNTLIPSNGDAPCTFIHSLSLPQIFARGDVRQLHICGFDGHLPITTLIQATTLFGTGPLWLIWWITSFSRKASTLPPSVMIASCYGGLAFICAPLFGSSVDRLLMMGWPLFFIGLPALVYSQIKKVDPWLIAGWGVSAWSGWLFFRLPHAFGVRATILLFFLAGIYAFTWRRLRRWSTGPTASLIDLPLEHDQSQR